MKILMADLIVIAVVAMLIGAALLHIRKAKKKGAACIGCPGAGACSGCSGCGAEKK